MEPFDLRDGGDEFSSLEPATLIVGRPNQTFTIRMRLLASGQPTEGSIYVSFYASADPSITPSDYYLGRTSVGGTLSGSTPLTLRITFPTSIPRGVYYVGWIIDPAKEMQEANENDNTAYEGTQLLKVVNPSEGILYVDAAARGTNDGSSWRNALTALQDALTLAESGREIRVAKGVYTPDRGLGIARENREASFRITGSLTLRGGYAGADAPDPNARDVRAYATILSGDLRADDLPVVDPGNLWKETSRTDNSRHVLTAIGINPTAILDGVQVSGGYAFGPSTAAADGAQLRGAGLIVSGGTLKLRNCTFTNNWASGDGGALYAGGSAHLEMIASTFRANGAGTSIGQAQGTGGAICSDGTGQLILSGCEFLNNFAGSQGGALDNDKGSLTLIRCRFLRNHAGNSGGGAIWNSEGQLSAFYCLFAGNQSDYSGGAIANGWRGTLYAANCCLNANSSKVQAGAVDNFFGGRTTLTSCTLTANHQDGGLAAITCGPALDGNSSELTIANSILWDGGSEILNQGKSVITVTGTDIQGGWPGAGNLAADPLFIQPHGPDGIAGTEDDNLRLGSGSPCVDHGSRALLAEDSMDSDGDGNLNESLPFDLDGNPRIFGAGLDMGAYERQVPCGS